MSGGGGVERLARNALRQARAMKVPELPDSDIDPPGRVEFARAAGIEPDDWQAGVLDSNARKLLMLCSRQSGKSTVAALLADYEAIYKPESLTLMLAPTLRQSSELARKCFAFYRSLPFDVPKIVSESTLRMELENGSRIIALPGNEATTRGYSAATQLIIDEAARVPDALIAAARPSLATTNGRIVALSTPAGKRGWFYLAYTSEDGWDKTRITARDCPRITEEFLRDELQALGEFQFNQEYLCEFFDPETSVFSSALIERAMTDDVAPLWSDAA